MRTAIILIVSLLTGVIVMTSAERTVTTRRKLTTVTGNTVAGVVAGDTLTTLADSVSLSGYDKKLRSRRETFLLVNRSGRHLRHVNVTFVYSDLQGRMLHSATVGIDCDIPAGETRQLSVPSWDIQQLYFYRESPAPRVAATPYNVSHRVNYVVADGQNVTLTENP
ncbi:MAG: hypothetical protein NC117_10210 [Pseudoflavonifractor sp.]|nr:hypothetical protein [Pseudoflavonifractor sp.]